MIISATIEEAKTNLSELIAKAQSGDTVTITSGLEQKPVVTLQAVEPARKLPRLGFMEVEGWVLGDAFWEPMSDEECGLAGEDVL